MFGFLVSGLFAVSIFSSHMADLRSGTISPEFSVAFEDTSENRSDVIEETAKTYGYFLTNQAHEKESATKLRAQGMWVEMMTSEDYFPPRAQVEVFVKYLIQAMEADLSRDRGCGLSTKLGVDYSPDKGPLLEAFQKAGLDVRCNLLLPYKSLTYLEIKENQLHVNVWLKGLGFKFREDEHVFAFKSDS